MAKQITIFIFIVGLWHMSFAQDSIFNKKGWQIEGGINMLIPVSNYNEEIGLDCFDCLYGKFKVKPRFTATNFFVDFNYRCNVYEWKNSYIGTLTKLGYRHLERKNIKEGYYGGEGIQGFEGTITNEVKEDYFFVESAINYNLKIKKTWAINQISISSNALFHYYTRGRTFSTEFINSMHITLNYELGVMVPLKKKIIFYPSIEVPLVQIISQERWGNIFGQSPFSPTPYFTSINNMAYLNVGIGVIYILK